MKAVGGSLVSILEAQVHEAESHLDQVGVQRERNHRYYALQPLGNERKGFSRHISPDVFDAVEARKAFFEEVFFSGRHPIKITPGPTGSQDEADQRTGYALRVLKENDWQSICDEGWHDAMVAKRMVVFIEWREDTAEEEIEVQGLTPASLQMAMQQNPRLLEIEPLDGTIQQGAVGGMAMPMFTGTIRQTLDNSRVKLSLIQPERYYRDGSVAHVADGSFAGFSMELSRAEAIRRGYDEEQISNLRTDHDMGRRQEDWARKSHDGSQQRISGAGRRAKEQQDVTIYRTWTWLDMSGFDEDLQRAPVRNITRDGLALVEVHWANGEVLRWADGSWCIEERDELPFAEYTEYKISHAEHGLSTADVMASTQRTKSILKRLVVDNQVRVNTSRWEAKNNALKNPRELIDNSVGGVVWSRDGQSVRPLEQPQLSPLTMQALEMLDRDKEERGGSSRLAQGLNTDAVRYQNAADMVERLTNNANKRNAKAARLFANFVGKVMTAICRVGQKYDRSSYRMEIAGRVAMVSPQAWTGTDYDYDTGAALTPDEGLKHAQTLLMMDAQMVAKQQAGAQTGDPTWSMIYSPANQHALYDDVFDALGVPDTSRYMTRPDSPEYQQQMMAYQQQQAQQAQQAQQVQMAQFQLLERQVADAERRTQLEGIKTQSELADTLQDNQRADRELEQNRVISFEEIAVKRQAINAKK